MSNTLKFGDGKWAIKKGSTLAYNDENGNFKPLPFTFDRAGSATRVNKQGLIEVVPNNEPRIDFLNDSKGALLLEPTRVNYCENSSDASQWSEISVGTIITTSNYGISPDGTLNATRLQASVSGSDTYSLLNLATTTVFFGDYTSFVYVKSNNSSNQTVAFYGRNTDGATSFTVTNEWTKIEFKGSSASGQANFANLGVNTGENSDTNIDILVWGGQLEQGSYATSYIPTQGGIGTRVAETCNGAGNDQVFNDSEGVLFAEISAFENVRLGISENSSTVNRVLLGQNPNGDVFSLVTVGSSPIYTYSASGFSLNENIKVALKYRESDFALWVNGIEVDNQQSGITFSSDTLNVLDFTGQSADFYGNTKQLQYFNKALSNAELAALTKI